MLQSAAVTIVVVFAVSSAGVHGADSPNFLYELVLEDEQRTNWLDAHNYLRRQVTNPEAADMKLMTWDTGLENLAKQVVRTCSFYHTDETDRRTDEFEVVGENLYTGGDYRYSEIMARDGVTKLWFDEIQWHDMDTLTCQSGKECGHYLQVIWAKTHKVGCAIGKCSAIAGGHPPFLICCNYGPVGNSYIGGSPVPPFTPGESCTMCGEGYECVDQLCNATATVPSTATTQPVVTTQPSITSAVSTTFSHSTMFTTQTTANTSTQAYSTSPKLTTIYTTTGAPPTTTTTSVILTTTGCTGASCLFNTTQPISGTASTAAFTVVETTSGATTISQSLTKVIAGLTAMLMVAIVLSSRSTGA